jgi:tetratricopeptide (TPR) repeat protein
MRGLRIWCVLAVAACLPASVVGQDVPKATPAGQKALDELVEACVADGGLTRQGEGPKATWRVDNDKLRATVAGSSKRLTPELRAAAVANFLASSSDPSRESERAMRLAVLREVAEETKDARALGFASFFAGFESQQRGQLEEAERAYERAVKHFAEAQGHPYLVISLNTLGGVLKVRGEYEKAQGYFEQALEMCRKVYPPQRYPQGHPDLALSLNNLGSVLQVHGEYEKALGYYEQALEMYRKLYPPERYPQGHRDLAQSFNNLGSVLGDRGE